MWKWNRRDLLKSLAVTPFVATLKPCLRCRYCDRQLPRGSVGTSCPGCGATDARLAEEVEEPKSQAIEGPAIRPVFRDGSKGEWARSEVVEEWTETSTGKFYKKSRASFEFDRVAVVVGAEANYDFPIGRRSQSFASDRYLNSGDTLQVSHTLELENA